MFAADGEVDFFAAFCEPLPSQIFLSQLGLPLDDVPFLLWVKNGVIRPVNEEHRASAGPKLIEYLDAELDRREATGEPQDDLIGGFLAAEVDGHPSPTSKPTSGSSCPSQAGDSRASFKPSGN